MQYSFGEQRIKHWANSENNSEQDVIILSNEWDSSPVVLKSSIRHAVRTVSNRQLTGQGERKKSAFQWKHQGPNKNQRDWNRPGELPVGKWKTIREAIRESSITKRIVDMKYEDEDNGALAVNTDGMKAVLVPIVILCHVYGRSSNLNSIYGGPSHSDSVDNFANGRCTRHGITHRRQNRGRRDIYGRFINFRKIVINNMRTQIGTTMCRRWIGIHIASGNSSYGLGQSPR